MKDDKLYAAIYNGEILGIHERKKIVKLYVKSLFNQEDDVEIIKIPQDLSNVINKKLRRKNENVGRRKAGTTGQDKINFFYLISNNERDRAL